MIDLSEKEGLVKVFGVPEFQLERGDGWATGLTSAGLTKPAFLSTNREQFTRLRAEITSEPGASIRVSGTARQM